MGKSKRNICYSLYNREISRRTNSKKDFRILRTLVCHSDRKFEKVWSSTSKVSFNYEAGRLFSERYRTCHFGYSTSGGPVQLYRRASPCFLEDALIYRCCHENFHRFDNKGYLFGIDAQYTRGLGGSLVQFSLDTGQMCRKIFLSQMIRFKHMAWVEQNETFVVISTHLPKRHLQMEIGRPLNIAIIMAVFSAFPLEFVGMFEVDKRVFGPGIHNAILSHGLLIVMYVSGHVRCFSFKYILEKYKLFDYTLDQATQSDSSGSFHCDNPRGLPINIKITECPPLLFEVRCAEQDVQIGGFPWHYIIQPHGIYNTFQVHCLEDNKKAREGTLYPHYSCTEPDRCVFHNDNSGRILHLRAPEVGVYSITPGVVDQSGCRYTLHMDSVIKLVRDQPKASTDVQVTSSGRCIRKRQMLDEIASDQDVVIHQVDYEDDLDLTYISALCVKRDQPNIVGFYDNQSFELLREISLGQKWDETYEYTLHVDLDTIIEVAKPGFSRFVCTMYRLSGTESPETPGPPDKRGTRGTSRNSRENESGTQRRNTRRRTR